MRRWCVAQKYPNDYLVAQKSCIIDKVDERYSTELDNVDEMKCLRNSISAKERLERLEN